MTTTSKEITVDAHLDPWISTGLTVANGQQLTIVAKGSINLWPSDGSMPWVGPDGYPPLQVTFAPAFPAAMLLGKIGTAGTTFGVGSDYDVTYTGTTGELFLTTNDDTGWWYNSRGYFTASIVVGAPGETNNNAPCPYGNDQRVTSNNPIELDKGNKVLSATDVSLQTPAGPLTCERRYNQQRQTDPQYQFMGLGWSHNHASKLALSGSSPNRHANVYLSNGGILNLDEDSANPGHFNSQPGSTSVLDYDAPSSAYILTAQDKSKFIFDATTFQLKSRAWPSGETWNYTYSNGKLSQVDDGYQRQLKFSYVSDPGGYDDGLLWRVGDQTASGLDTSTPAGRYVEFGYTPEKNNGVTVSNPKGLLASVRDVRGNTWTYDYYGQHSGENVSGQLDFLTARLSPQVDTTGDGVVDQALTLEHLAYTLSGTTITAISQQRGNNLLQTDLAFQAGGKNATTETVAGKTTTHYFANGAYLGAGRGTDENAPLNLQVMNDRYRPISQVNGRGKATALGWSGDGKQLNGVTDALGKDTAFAYDSSDRLLASVDAQKRTTGYLYDASLRQPTLVMVAADNLVVNGDMEVDSGWTGISGAAPTTNQQSTTKVDSGSYSRRVVASAAGQGIEGNTWNLGAGRAYVALARVYPVSGTVKMQVSGTTSFDVLSSGTGAWQTLRAIVTPASGASNVKVQFIASGAAGEFYVDTVSVSVVGDLVVNGSMEVDSGWTAISGAAPTTNERSTTQVDTGSYSRHLVASAAGQGIEGNAWDVATGRTYLAVARVYPVSGAVSMKLSGTSAMATSSGTGSWQTLRIAYTATSSITGVKVQFVASGGAGEFYVDSVHVVDATALLRWQEFHYDSRGRALSESAFDPSNVTTPQQQVTREYYASGNGNGLLYRITQKDIGGTNDTTTTNTYDSAGRLVKTQQSSTFGSCSISYTVYDAAGNVVAAICNYDPGNNPDPTTADQAVALYNSAYPDKNRVTRYDYDPLGRQFKTTTDAGATGLAQTTLTVYDALNRLIRTIANYVADGSISNPFTAAPSAFNHGTDNNQNLVADTVYNTRGLVESQTDGLGNVTRLVYDDPGRPVRTITNYIAQGTSDPANWLWSTANNRWEDGAGNPINHGTNNDQNIISDQAYDGAGNLVKTVDTLHNVSFRVYDALNRPVKTVRNAKDTASVDYYDNDTQHYVAANDPRSSSYTPSTSPDRDLIEITEYDTLGRVRRTQDTLGHWTLYGYDILGRQVKVIPSASNPSYNTTIDPSLSGYSVSANPDVDIVTKTAYDSAARVMYTEDVLGARTWNAYDGLGRLVKTVASAGGTATDGSANDPRSSSYVPSANPDQDLIARTFYDTSGRAYRTQDTLGRDSLTGFDSVARPVKTIRNASNPTYNVANDPSLGSYTSVTNPDVDIVTKAAYDSAGRVMYTEDALGARTWIAYDILGRRVKTVASAVGTASDGSANDPRSNSYVPSSNPDQDLVSRAFYDLGGRVYRTQDAFGRDTLYGYDLLGRQVKVIQNASNPTYYIANDPSLGSYTPVTDPDKDVITRTIYDRAGRVVKTVDPRGNEIYFVYDTLGRQLKTITNYIAQGTSDPANWLWSAANSRWENGSGSAISRGTDNDENTISAATYDKGGQVTVTRDAAGMETRYVYDAARRWTQMTVNYVDGSFNPNVPDEDLISATTYNKGGQILTATDARGTQTALAYDRAGRRLTVTQAAGSPLAVISYTNYDKGGQVLRSIANYIPLYDANHQLISPDGKDGQGNWLFNPTAHGQLNDQNLITTSTLDAAGRQTAVTDPLGNSTATAHFKDGQIQSLTDPEGMVTQYRYDAIRRRTRVVQGYVAQGASDPKDWVWSTVNNRWERGASDSTAIVNGANNDQNIIVLVTYDKAGRTTSQRDPRGNMTSYTYDLLDRRTALTNPLNKTWQTTYANVSGGTSRMMLTNPNGSSHQVQRDFDKLGRLKSLKYLNESPKNTPDVSFAYDLAGNRAKMSEYTGANFTNRVRETTYGYDKARRLTSDGFDDNGDGVVDETVSYQYDAGGLRTRLTLPGSLNVTYSYDARGQLVSLTDWDGQPTQLAYDNVGRQVATFRSNELRTRYAFDAAGRLRMLRHDADLKTLAHFAYEVDRRGNRTQALESLRRPGSGTNTILHGDTGVAYRGAWTDTGSFHETTQFSASLSLLFLGSQNVTLTMGEGPDHSIYDVYVGNTLWQSFNGYAATAGQRTITVPLDGDGPFTFEVRNRAEKDARSSGYKLRFQSLAVGGTYDAWTLRYTYDGLSRLLDAKYYPGQNTGLPDANLLRRYQYAFDVAGNRTQQIVTVAGTPTTSNYTYNAANQISNAGFSYDNNSNLTSDGTNTFTWDRANRLLSVGGATYGYDGAGNRVQQTVGANVTQYLLDLQPGLAVVLSDTIGANTTRYIHGPMGIHARKDAANAWHWTGQDALGSVRVEVSSGPAVEASRDFDPFGNAFGVQGTFGTPYEFTGELKDGNGLLDLRARYYGATLSVFMSLDPIEGIMSSPGSLNRYAYVNGNPVNRVDPLGLFDWPNLTTESGDYLYCIGRDMGIDPEDHSGQIDKFISAMAQLNPDAIIKYSADCPPNAPGCPSEQMPWLKPGITLQFPQTYWLNGMVLAGRYGNFGRHCGYGSGGVTVTPTPTLTPTPSMTPSPTNTPTLTPTPSMTPSPMLTPSPTVVPTCTPSPSPTASPQVPGGTIIGGYIEGATWTLTGASIGDVHGVEVVYNFATFQRMEWKYSGSGFSFVPQIAAGQAALYIGHVEGFQQNLLSPDNFAQFQSQYGGNFAFVQLGAGVSAPPPFSALSATSGWIHFYSYPSTPTPTPNSSYPSTPNGVYGNIAYISGSVSTFPKPIDISYGIANYVPEPGKDYYINGCSVDIGRLIGDILTGRGSPHLQGPFSVNYQRGIAAIAAAVAASNYNSQHCGP